MPRGKIRLKITSNQIILGPKCPRDWLVPCLPENSNVNLGLQGLTSQKGAVEGFRTDTRLPCCIRRGVLSIQRQELTLATFLVAFLGSRKVLSRQELSYFLWPPRVTSWALSEPDWDTLSSSATPPWPACFFPSVRVFEELDSI